VRELRGSYDYIVFDTAAVPESADVNSVCECSDAALLVARSGKSRQRDLARAAAQLAPATLAGVVLIDT
jgi:Mrp family chromosome partitioning ATPase